jgi:hypothetical protein
MRIQCAECHNHPFDRWSQDYYYGFVSFFTGIKRKTAREPREFYIYNDNSAPPAPHMLDQRPMPPKFLGGETPDTAGKDPRVALATWLTAPENTLFSKNMANRIWAHFLGRGVVEPIDDFRINNPPSNSELLDELAAKGFDALEVRYVLAGSHYRAPLNFTLASLEAARPALARLGKAAKALGERAGGKAVPDYASLVGVGPGPFAAAWASLNDDLNTAEALGHVFVALRGLKAESMTVEEAAAAYGGLHFMLAAFGLVLPEEEEVAVEIPEEVRRLAERRWEARLAKEWAASDVLRAEIDALGWVMKDGKESWELVKKG